VIGVRDIDLARINEHTERRRTNGRGNGGANSDDDSWWETPAEEPWLEIDPAALCGVAGEIVESVSPATDGDTVAILMNTVIMFGNAVGRKPYFKVGATRHYPVEFGLLVGRTAKARKGTAHNEVERIFIITAPEWVRDCRQSGLSSGEGLIALIHDEIDSKHPAVTDKRAMVIETEFANTLTVMTREGNTLSGVIRDCWDCRPRLSILTKNSPIHASNPHVSILGHITLDELRFQLDRVHLTNGFANRFLIAVVKRSQLLPFGGEVEAARIDKLGNRLRAAIEQARMWQEIPFTGDAKLLWQGMYAELSKEVPGLFGSVIARTEAHTARLAMMFALLDLRREIGVEHLEAALAVWRYCEASARYIFGDAIGNAMADEILRALRQVGRDGMTRTEISNLFGRNRSADRIGAALVLLLQHGKARRIHRATQGRPIEVWIAS
jgi:hypothetical protein